MKSSPRIVLPLMVMILSLAAAALTAARLSPEDTRAASAESVQGGGGR
jgi:hypothetical protein